MIRSPLRYPGGKNKALPQILPLIPKGIKDWRETFFGGGSVTIGYLQNCEKRPEVITVGDLATEVYMFWKQAQQNPSEVADQANKWFCEYPGEYNLWDFVNKYNKDVSLDITELTEVERAARFYLCNRISFSGLTDSSGSVSPTQYNKFKLEHTEQIVNVSNILQGIDIRNCTYEDIMFISSPFKNEEVFVFLDPPYMKQEESALYGRNGDTHRGFNHSKFAEDTMKCPFNWLVTYDDSPQIRKMFEGAYQKQFSLTYGMTRNGCAEDALAGEEIFISNYDINEIGKSSWSVLNDFI